MRSRLKLGVLGIAAMVAAVALVPTRSTVQAEPAEGLEIGHLDASHFAEAAARADDPPGLTPAAATPGTTFAGFNPITPDRVLDTRPGLPAFAGVTALGPDSAIDVQISGRSGVPAGAGAVVLNVTVTSPSAGGYLTVWPTGAPRPGTSSLNMVPGQTVPNAVVVKLGTDGKISVYNNAGITEVLVDVVAWARDDGHFIGLTPSRILDTRAGSPVGAAATLSVPVLGVGGVPASGVSTVVLNVTATQPTAASYLTIWPAGAARPIASNLNMAADQTVPNLVYAPVGAEGRISIFNERGTTHLLADVVGYIPAGSAFVALTPTRVMDTRTGAGNYGVPNGNALSRPIGKLGPRQAVSLDVNAFLNDPYVRLTSSTVQAFVFNVTTVEATEVSFLTLYPAGEPLPNTSNLNMVPDKVVANAVVVKAGTTNRVNVFNAEGSTHVIVDLVGFVPRQNGSDTPDGIGGSKYHVVYVQGSDSNADPSFVNGALANIRTEVDALDGWFALPAQTGRHLNIDRTNGQIEVSYVRYTRFTRAQLVNWEQDFTSSVLTQLIDDGFGSSFGRLWLVYFDGVRADGVCGIAALQFTTVFMQNGCGTVNGTITAANVGNSANTAEVALHEMLHGLGAANPCSPTYDRTDTNNDGRPDHPGHVADDSDAFNGSDLMYWNTGRQPKFIDLEGDDYFGRNGSNPCVDIGKSPFIAP